MSSDELEKLAAEGRARKAAAASRLREGKAEEERERRQEHRLVLHNSLSAFSRWGWIVAGIPLGAAFAAIAGYFFVPQGWFLDGEGEEGGPGGLVLMVIFFGAFLVTRALRARFGQKAVEQERAWVAALPFALTGYQETLEGMANDGELKLSLTYEDSVPQEVHFVADVLSASGATVSETGRVHQVSRRFSWESSVSTNLHVAQWIHQVAPALIALHGKWRLQKVEVKASWQ